MKIAIIANFDCDKIAISQIAQLVFERGSQFRNKSEEFQISPYKICNFRKNYKIAIRNFRKFRNL